MRLKMLYFPYFGILFKILLKIALAIHAITLPNFRKFSHPLACTQTGNQYKTLSERPCWKSPTTNALSRLRIQTINLNTTVHFTLPALRLAWTKNVTHALIGQKRNSLLFFSNAAWTVLAAGFPKSGSEMIKWNRYGGRGKYLLHNYKIFSKGFSSEVKTDFFCNLILGKTVVNSFWNFYSTLPSPLSLPSVNFLHAY